MARKQRSTLDDLFDLLKIAPIWVGPVLALVVFLVFHFLLPALTSTPKAGGADTGIIWRPMLPILSWVFAGAVLLAWAMAEAWKLANRRLLDSQTGIETIRDLSWREFERLVSEAYRRKGYMAEVVGCASGDGGIDIRLTGPGETILIQCKQWKAYTVGVTTVRELLGVVVSERATKGIVVTSGRFTREARAFASHNPQIDLVDGPQLTELVRDVQAGPQHEVRVPPPRATQPACPQCGAPMVLRTARKGQRAGSQFWGCPKYPACRGTQEQRITS